MTSQYQNNEPMASININHSTGGAAEFETVVSHLMGKNYTIMLVQVVGTETTGLNPVGFVDIKPMVYQIDGAGNTHEMGTIFNVPYFRLQGGADAVIIDPKVGDIGIAAIVSRDISKVKRTRQPAAPGSRRQFDCADAVYFGGFLNGTPSQYIQFKDGGIKLFSPGDIEIEAANVSIKTSGNVTTTASGGISSQSATFQAQSQATAQFTGGGGMSIDGRVQAAADVIAGSISLQNHIHTGDSGGKTGGPE